MAASMKLCGIYALYVDDRLTKNQALELYGPAPSSLQVEQVRQQLKSVVLAEVLISGADEKFSVADFTQETPGQPRSNWQCAWAEVFLSPDGENVLARAWRQLPRGITDYRIAFYLHFWNPGLPLLTSYGPLQAPPPSPIPERLARLAPFIPAD